MKKSKSLLKILILLILAGSIVNAEYFKENGKIYYNLPYYEIKSEVKEADSESFEILKSDDENGEFDDYYGKDKKNVYFWGKKLENVSSNGFEILDGEKFRYKTEIYYYDEESGTVKKEK